MPYGLCEAGAGHQDLPLERPRGSETTTGRVSLLNAQPSAPPPCADTPFAQAPRGVLKAITSYISPGVSSFSLFARRWGHCIPPPLLGISSPSAVLLNWVRRFSSGKCHMKLFNLEPRYKKHCCFFKNNTEDLHFYSMWLGPRVQPEGMNHLGVLRAVTRHKKGAGWGYLQLPEKLSLANFEPNQFPHMLDQFESNHIGHPPPPPPRLYEPFYQTVELPPVAQPPASHHPRFSNPQPDHQWHYQCPTFSAICRTVTGRQPLGFVQNFKKK